MSDSQTPRPRRTAARGPSRPARGRRGRRPGTPARGPIQTTPNSVTASCTIACWRTSATADSQNASNSVPNSGARRPRQPALVDGDRDQDHAQHARRESAAGTRASSRQTRGWRPPRSRPPAAVITQPPWYTAYTRDHSAAGPRSTTREISAFTDARICACGRRRRRAPRADRRRRSPATASGVKCNSAYAACHSRKFEIRSSPEVRITRSGSGISGAYRRAATAPSSIASGSTPSAHAGRASPHDLVTGAVVERHPQVEPGVGARCAPPCRASARAGSSGQRSRRPMKCMRTPWRCRSGNCSRIVSSNSAIRSVTSSSGRPQFSVENAYTARLRTPSPGAASTVRRSALVPARCPASSGSPRDEPSGRCRP